MVNFLKKINTKTAIIIASCLCIIACTVGGVWAYLTSKTHTYSNTFSPAKVTCAIEENFTNGIKNDVKVRNTGNIDAYIRAVVVVTFVSDDGKIHSKTPNEGVDYTVTWSNNGWQIGSDGFWYYSKPVPPNGLTTNLIDTASAVSVPDGYRLNVQIIATAIQSDPETAVQNAWKITPTNGKLIPD